MIVISIQSAVRRLEFFSREKDFYTIFQGHKELQFWDQELCGIKNCKDVDIFEKDFLVFPMNDRNGKHWNLFILCYPRYFLEKSEHDDNAATQRKPFLLYFDSMNVLPQQDPEIPKLISW